MALNVLNPRDTLYSLIRFKVTKTFEIASFKTKKPDKLALKIKLLKTYNYFSAAFFVLNPRKNLFSPPRLKDTKTFEIASFKTKKAR